MEFLPLLRELVRNYQAFESYSVPHIKSMDLTPPQFDVIATLANQPAMTCKELGEKTLITKGTLTGILDRLEIKELVKRQTNNEDGRSQKIILTKSGQALFDSVFPSHMKHLEKAFNKLTNQEMTNLTNSLKQLRQALEQTN
jgi:MarR family 2-MHQ and catechol resistance regulon transcriptional repressor